MTHIWLSRAAHVTELCHSYEWITPWHMWMSRVAHVTELCHSYEWITHSRECLESVHDTHMNEHGPHVSESYHTPFFFLWPQWLHFKNWFVTHINESSHSWVSHVIHMNYMLVSHAFFLCETIMTIFQDSAHTYKWVTSLIWMNHVAGLFFSWQ